jgi:predicted nucleic acid-binding protein
LIIVDSDVLIDALAGIEPQRSVVEEELRMRRLAVPAIVHFELLVGAPSGEGLRRIQHLLRPMAVLDFHREAAEEAAAVGRRLAGKGLTLPMADLAIAGICIAMDLPLLTRNTKHFGRIEELRLEPLTQ